MDGDKDMIKFLLALISLLFSTSSIARNEIRVVGSSTVYPFVSYAAEQFGSGTDFKTPVVESTGTGGGFKLFCSGVGTEFPDVVNASRAVKESEKKRCAKNGITNIIEIKIGYDGIVLANIKNGKKYSFTKEQVFLALAKEVPSGGRLVPNFYKKWSDIDPSLSSDEIRVYGPPPTSGTRDAFVELVMHEACQAFKVYKDKHACSYMREDGHFIEAGENDNLIVQKLIASPHSLGIFGFSFLDQNSNKIKPTDIDNVVPTFEAIADGSYSVSRPLFTYIKGEHIGKIRGLKEFASELVSEDAIGEDGYLTYKGLIPLPQCEFEKVVEMVEGL